MMLPAGIIGVDLTDRVYPLPRQNPQIQKNEKLNNLINGQILENMVIDLTWFNLIAIWCPSVNIPNLYFSRLQLYYIYIYSPYKSNPDSNSSHIPPN